LELLCQRAGDTGFWTTRDIEGQQSRARWGIQGPTGAAVLSAMTVALS